MTWSLKASANAGTSATGGTITVGDTTGADIIIVQVSYGNSAAQATVTDNKGNTYTALTAYTINFGSPGYVQFFYAKSATVGTGHTVTISNIDNFYASACIEAWAGSDLTTPFDTETGAGTTSGSTSWQPGSITPDQDNSLIVTSLFSYTTTATAVSSPFATATVNAFNSGASYAGAMSNYVQATAAAINPTWTVSSAPVIANIAAFKGASGGGGTTYNQSCLASTSPVASLGRGVSKQALGSTSSVAKLVRTSSKALRGSTSSVGTLSRRTAKTANGSTQSVASLKRSTAKTALSSTSSVASLSTLKVILISALASTSSVASLKRSTGKVAKASTASVATIKRAISKTYLASTSTAATLAKSIAKSFKASSASVASAIVSRLGPTIAKLFEIFAAFSSAPLSASGAIAANTIQASGAIIDPLAISAPFQSASVSASGSMNDDPVILQGEF